MLLFLILVPSMEWFDVTFNNGLTLKDLLHKQELRVRPMLSSPTVLLNTTGDEGEERNPYATG